MEVVITFSCCLMKDSILDWSAINLLMPRLRWVQAGTLFSHTQQRELYGGIFANGHR